MSARDLGGADVSLADIQAAAERLRGRIRRTPMLPARDLADASGTLLLKCENLQETGAFKARGALNHILQLDAGALSRGVATYSSGNHGAALAWAARQLGAKATVFVPEDIPAGKRAAIEACGGAVVPAGRTSADRRQACEAARAREGFAIVPPFDDPWIIAGQGTCGLEILGQAGDVARVLVPVGGGGLIAGIALAIKTLRSSVEIVGVEPEAAASLGAALAAGRPVEIEVGETIADGLKPVKTGRLNFEIARRCVDRVVTVSDAEIRAAMRCLFERARLVVEPSGAATVAAHRSMSEPAGGGRASGGVTVAVLSGGNVDVARLGRLLDQ